MGDLLHTESSESKLFFAFRDDMLGANRSLPATAAHLRTAGNLIYGDESLFSLYGISASELAARNFTVLGRTLIESCIDAYANALSLKIREILSADHKWPDANHQGVIYDLFCGSGNISYHIGRLLDRPVFASDTDRSVYNATQHNLSLLQETSKPGLHFRFNLSLIDYRRLLVTQPTAHHPTDIYIIEPPWGSAFTADGLDLTMTCPPVQDIVADIRSCRAGVPCYIALKTTDHTAHGSLQTAMAGASPVAVVQCLPKYTYGIDFHIYVLN